MKAVQMTEVGGPEVLQLVKLPDPQPGPGQVLIRVESAAARWGTYSIAYAAADRAHAPLCARTTQSCRPFLGRLRSRRLCAPLGHLCCAAELPKADLAC